MLSASLFSGVQIISEVRGYGEYLLLHQVILNIFLFWKGKKCLFFIGVFFLPAGKYAQQVF